MSLDPHRVKNYAGEIFVLNRKTGEYRRAMIQFVDITASDKMLSKVMVGRCGLPLPR